MKTVKLNIKWIMAVVLATSFASTNVMATQDTGSPTHPNHPAAQKVKMTDADAENIVRRSLQYVALYDTLLSFCVNKKNPFASGGWNKTHYPEGQMDASVRAIPRPNNDTLYVMSLMDLRADSLTTAGKRAKWCASLRFLRRLHNWAVRSSCVSTSPT